MKKWFSLLILLFIYAPGIEAQVNIQTGSAVFDLPVFQWKDNKSRLYLDISLHYNSGNGLKVNEVASDVGVGWNLLQGGVIERLQVGEPDDQKGYYEGMGSNQQEQDGDLKKYPNGYLYAEVPAYLGVAAATTRYPIFSHRNTFYKEHNVVADDKKLDYFSFSFNGRSGRFVIDPYRGKGISLGDSKMKISYQENTSLASHTTSGIRTTITSFTIQDVDGLIYTFSDYGMFKILEQDFCDANGEYPQKQPEFKDQHIYYQSGFESNEVVDPWIINQWYLSRIKDPLTGRKIEFSYETVSVDERTGTHVTIHNQDDEMEYATLSFNRAITKSPRISGISLSDGHQVSYNYATEPRVDLPGENALSSVDIEYGSRAVSTFEFKTSYIILNRYGNPETAYQKNAARLCLLSVRKIGVDLKEDEPPYQFDYYLGGSAPDDFVPPPYFYAHDIWGFYNGDASKSYEGVSVPLTSAVGELSFSQLKGLCFLRQGQTDPVNAIKDEYAQNGLLKEVVYPAGGTLTYHYGQNKGRFPSGTQDVSVKGVHVSQISSADGGYDCGDPLVMHYQYIQENGTSSLWGVENPANESSIKTDYAPANKKFKYKPILNFKCDYEYKYPGILSEYQATRLAQPELLEQCDHGCDRGFGNNSGPADDSESAFDHSCGVCRRYPERGAGSL